jgi:hypothetical protein
LISESASTASDGSSRQVAQRILGELKVRTHVMPAARWFLLSSDPGRLWPRPRNGRLQQEKISPRLARIESDDRMTLCGEGETFRLAIQIPKLPHIKELRSATTRREIVEARNGGGLVTQQIERTIRTYFEVAEVDAGFGQSPIGTPDCESNEPMVPLF